MNEELKKLIERGKKVDKDLNDLHKEILNHQDLPQSLKDEIIKLNQKLENDKLEHRKYLEENKHRKIIGYNIETFMPIYE